MYEQSRLYFAGEFVSFEDVEVYDYIYRLSLAGVFFLVILRLLEPLSFNYHLYILQNALNRSRGELFSYILILTTAIFAFASYLYLTVGKLVEDFKDMITAMKTLLQMLLSMISFRFNVQMSSLQAQIVVSVFAFAVSMIGINIFIGILTWNFYYMKVYGDCDEKDTDLNNSDNKQKEKKQILDKQGDDKQEYGEHSLETIIHGKQCDGEKITNKLGDNNTMEQKQNPSNENQNECKNPQSVPKRFNYELNAHFWFRVNGIIQRVIPSRKKILNIANFDLNSKLLG